MIASIITFVIALLVSGIATNHHRLALLWQRVEPRLSPTLSVVAAAAIYCVVVGGVALLRHLSLNSNALDMGLMDQIVWNSAHGRWFEESFITGRPASFLGHHFSPSLALLVPFYWLLPRPETLIVVQVGLIAGSALLLYGVALRLTVRVWVAAGLALMLLLHPLVQDAALFDFHQDAIGMFFLAFGLFGITYRRWGIATVGWLVSLLAKEEVAIYWIAIGLFFLLVDEQRWLLKTLFVLVSGVWLYVVIAFLMPAFQGEGHAPFTFVERYAFWGSSIGEVIGTIVGRPIESLQMLLLPDRIGGLGMMLLPVLLFLLRGHWATLLLLMPLGINSLADYVGQHNYRFHYSLLPIVMIVYACCWAIVFIQRRGLPNSSQILRRATLFMAVASIMLFVGVSQLGLRFPAVLQNYLPGDHDRLGFQVMQMIPSQARVIAQNKLVAHLSQRRQITLLSRQLAEPADLYLLDLQGPTAPQSEEEYLAEITALLANSEYGIAHLEDGYILLARDAPHNEAAVDAAMQMIEQFYPQTRSR